MLELFELLSRCLLDSASESLRYDQV
jgi:hypothetical protein